ncbi:helix-turn-helix domain-containing protein [Chryseobacterium echinoideorum]|uniref:helix-turn-helix domain-containing protein n=1 Tax=Chryseobacterium echinoideorum TaxID=1549648 RepID=UPI0011867735|nr:helix-turn-helix domain-containing protein [Chryseobacterium echinoideorum]
MLNKNNISLINVSKYPLQYQLLLKLNDANYLYNNGKYQEAKKAVLSSLALIQNNKKNLRLYQYESLKQIAISRLFYTEKRLGNIAEGLKQVNVFSKDMSVGYKKKQMIFFAVAYIELGNYKKGIEILNTRLYDLQHDPIVICNKLSEELETAATYNTKGDTFIKWYKNIGKQSFLDSAYYNYKNAYHVIKDVPDFAEYSKSLYHVRNANIALLKKQYSYALSLFNKCEKDSVLMSKVLSRETVWMGKSEIYTTLKKTDSAFYYIGKMYKGNEKIQCTYENLLKIYHLLSINYENTGNDKKAYYFAKLSLSEIDKVKSENVSGNFLLGLYEKKEIKSYSEEMIKKHTRKAFFKVFLIVFFLIIIACFFFLIINKRKKNTYLGLRIEEIPQAKDSHPVIETNLSASVIIEEKLVTQILSELQQLENGKRFLHHDFKLIHIAKELNTNTTYLSQIINEYKGKSFSEYVHDLRINYVLKELQENSIFRKYTIQTISEEIGYKSATTFVKAFKERVQITPSDYIKQLTDQNRSS